MKGLEYESIVVNAFLFDRISESVFNDLESKQLYRSVSSKDESVRNLWSVKVNQNRELLSFSKEDVELAKELLWKYYILWSNQPLSRFVV